MMSRIPTGILSLRGWGFITVAVIALFWAQVLGRRDLLYLGIFLLLLPLAAALLIRVLKPRFTIRRRFSPALVQTGIPSRVSLELTCALPYGGVVTMTEQVPSRFGEPPIFRYPARSAPRTGPSRYEYRLRSADRGRFLIGPVVAEFTDPFGLSRHRQTLGGLDPLTVTPAALELPLTSLTGARGVDGSTSTRVRSNPSNDDVMTREYRHGDPMRRVHWPATARHGTLMVRQEESVTTPQATIILDQRAQAYSTSFMAAFAAAGTDRTGMDYLFTTPNFEWQITALASAAAHLIERNYAVRILDAAAAPGVRRSPSAPWPDEEEFTGADGFRNLAESLAALGLAEEPVRRSATAAPAFDDRLLNKLAAHKLRGPLVALLGRLSPEEAHRLASASGFGSHAFAIMVVDRAPQAQESLDILHDGGWRAIAVGAGTPLPAAWTYFDAAQARPAQHGIEAVHP